jgi:hypothetical protein
MLKQLLALLDPAIVCYRSAFWFTALESGSLGDPLDLLEIPPFLIYRLGKRGSSHGVSEGMSKRDRENERDEVEKLGC